MSKTACMRRSLLLALPLSLALACASTDGAANSQNEAQTHMAPSSAEAPSTGQPARRAWTSRFQNESVLLADEIQIHGPKGLLEHVVSVQDPARVDYLVKTTPEGLRQVTSLRDGGQPAQIDAQIDAWRLVAFNRLVVVEQPGDVPVRVRGYGDAILRDSSTGERTEDAQLEFVGV